MPKGIYERTNEFREKMRLIAKNRFYSDATRKKMSDTKLGKKFTEEHKRKLSEANKGKHDNSGDKNPNWRGGINPINMQIRKSKEMELWRNEVFKRDNWICQDCNQIGGRLQADHIKPFAHFPELRFELSNGRTLCRNCHIKKTKIDNKLYYKGNQYSIKLMKT